jgi:hypothetical protein
VMIGDYVPPVKTTASGKVKKPKKSLRLSSQAKLSTLVSVPPQTIHDLLDQVLAGEIDINQMANEALAVKARQRIREHILEHFMAVGSTAEYAPAEEDGDEGEPPLWLAFSNTYPFLEETVIPHWINHVVKLPIKQPLPPDIINTVDRLCDMHHSSKVILKLFSLILMKIIML